jgi:hypothetical protein
MAGVHHHTQLFFHCLSWPQSTTFLISDSQGARITGMSY